MEKKRESEISQRNLILLLITIATTMKYCSLVSEHTI